MFGSHYTYASYLMTKVLPTLLSDQQKYKPPFEEDRVSRRAECIPLVTVVGYSLMIYYIYFKIAKKLIILFPTDFEAHGKHKEARKRLE